MLASLAHHPEPRRVLFIGLGGGTIPMVLRRCFEDVAIDNVELDPEVAKAAKDFFGFEEGPKMRLFVRDGRVQVRRFLKEEQRYDMIMIDAFRGGFIPYHLTTKEFMVQVKELLEPDGVVVMNLLSGYRSYDYQRRTLAEVFANVHVYRSGGNAIVVADAAAKPRSREDLVAAAERLRDEKGLGEKLPKIIATGGAADDYVVDGAILTDDYAPTDVLRGIRRE